MWRPKQRKHESHDSCVCIAGFSACGCQKKSVAYETECRHLAVHKGKQDQREIIALKHIQATLYLIRSEMGSQCRFCLERLDDGIRFTHEETVAVVELRGYRK